MKSKITITLIAILLCAVISYGFVLSRTSQNDISYDNPDGIVGTMSLSGPQLVAEIAPGLVFKIDTGSDLSTITAEGLAILEKMGYNPRKEIYPVLGRNGVGDIQLSATRYKIDLPFHHKVYENDSTTYNEIINVIHNVDFAPSKNGLSVLGIDFLQKFKIEYQYHNKALNLYVKLPAGYVQCVDLSYSKALMTSIWLGKRYYIPISIESDENNYFIDTGLQKVGIKLPYHEVKRTLRPLYTDTVLSARGQYSALIDHSAILSCGDRGGAYTAYYYDNDEEEFAMNPFNLFTQDVLIDFIDLKLYLRPTYNIPKRKSPESAPTSQHRDSPFLVNKPK